MSNEYCRVCHDRVSKADDGLCYKCSKARSGPGDQPTIPMTELPTDEDTPPGLLKRATGYSEDEIAAVLARIDHFRNLLADVAGTVDPMERRRKMSQVVNNCNIVPYDGYVFSVRMEEVFHSMEIEEQMEARMLTLTEECPW